MVFDGTVPTPEGLLHDSAGSRPGGSAPPPGGFTTRSTLEVAGRTWTLVFATGPAFGHVLEGSLIPFVFLGGLLTTLALTAVLWLEVRARDAAERVAAELREAEREREDLLARERKAHAEAQAANRAKDEFLATLSHELRTPLNAVLGWTRMLRAGQLDPGRQAHALEVIERNARAQAGLIEDLLDVSRIIAGKMRLDLRPVDFAEAVRAALDGMRPPAEAKKINIVATFSGAGRVMGDADRIHQIVANLLSNAIKFTPAGGRVDVTIDRTGASAVLAVSDTGIGIGPDFLPHIFDRFRQADGTSTRAHGGMGLGLSIVR
ncbi:MAG: HAMP domain-containing histidine kinase, partial [Acidobacteria bacterium]|nr:HAMP domain-containing histidine kinase [Acidobacteriota bacterium]